jgi:predicted aspartyl protease
MPAAEPRQTPEELARLGPDVFERRVRPMLRPDDDGKFVALDVQTGEYSGFTGSLTLSATTAAALGLTRQSGGGAVLADGSVRQFDIYAAEVEWNGGWRPVLVWATGNEALVGMRLLAGHELRIAVVPSGAVEITPLP